MKDKEINSLIVRFPNWIGDAVMATPILHDLRSHFPYATLTAMCQHPVAHLLAANPHLNEIFQFTKPNDFFRRQEERHLIDRLRQGFYDAGILLTNSFSSAWWFWRGNVKKRVGFATDFRRFLLTDPLPLPEQKGKEHQVITYKRLLAPFDIPLSKTTPELFLTRKENEDALKLLHQHGACEHTTLIGINPGAAYGSAKCWLPERFRALTERLLAHENFTIVYFGDASGASLVKEICRDMPPRVINLSGLTTIRELMALISKCHAFLTNDSGPMHIAAAFKVPLVALFGSTSDVATGPYQQGTVIHKHVECSPCFKRTCPIDFRCMTRIEVDEVYHALLEVINGQHKKRFL